MSSFGPFSQRPSRIWEPWSCQHFIIAFASTAQAPMALTPCAHREQMPKRPSINGHCVHRHTHTHTHSHTHTHTLTHTHIHSHTHTHTHRHTHTYTHTHVHTCTHTHTHT